MSLASQMRRLPLDIVKIIISYSHSYQSPVLLEDIRSFHKDKNKLLDIYYRLFVEEWNDPQPEDRAWLANDLIRYINDSIPTMQVYTEKCYSLFYRNPFLNSTEKVERYLILLDEKELDSQINILLGLLLPHERNEFIEMW
jgi:hypothetical protein